MAFDLPPPLRRRVIFTADRSLSRPAGQLFFASLFVDTLSAWAGLIPALPPSKPFFGGNFVLDYSYAGLKMSLYCLGMVVPVWVDAVIRLFFCRFS